MGLLFRRRRPLMRVAGAAALGTVAYRSGKGRANQDQYNAQAQAAYSATQGPPSGAPTDDEFSAAKSKLLGI